MLRKVSAMDVRKNFGRLMNEVSLRNDQFIIERNGKPLAALVPIWMIVKFQKNKEEFLSLMKTAQVNTGEVSEEEIQREIMSAIGEV